MTTYLVTGCAGFFGTTFVHYMLKKYTDIRIKESTLAQLKDLMLA